ncbi:MAG: hypothetical protein SFV18_10220 [Bryobacteraceae bacterium]|nr:hypothetical protein [Bryobacteraceae bacterium]
MKPWVAFLTFTAAQAQTYTPALNVKVGDERHYEYSKSIGAMVSRTPVTIRVVEVTGRGTVLEWEQGESRVDNLDLAARAVLGSMAPLLGALSQALRPRYLVTPQRKLLVDNAEELREKAPEAIEAFVKALPEEQRKQSRAAVEVFAANSAALPSMLSADLRGVIGYLIWTYPSVASGTLPAPLTGLGGPLRSRVQCDLLSSGDPVRLRVVTTPDPEEFRKAVNKIFRDAGGESAPEAPAVKLETRTEIEIESATGLPLSLVSDSEMYGGNQSQRTRTELRRVD